MLADDHDLFREGVAALLARDRDLVIVGQAKTRVALLELVVQAEADVLLLDVEMPGPPARALIANVRRASPDTKVVVLTMYRDVALAHELIAAGASLFISKATPATELITAIKRLARTDNGVEIALESRAFQLLTDRELRVLYLIAQARSNKAIGVELSIATGTVKRHVGNIFRKLGADSRMDAVLRAGRLGIFPSAE